MDYTSFLIGFGCGGFFVILVFLREILTAPPRERRRRRDTRVINPIDIRRAL